ncbi:MAG TPA: hypothetical protein VFL47_02435, partial [Flavisolibacter sp.]|nr:hypothetical protein [Flavisolibacter sp.]
MVLTLWCYGVSAQVYPVSYRVSSADSAQLARLSLSSLFATRMDADSYVAGLLPLLQNRGFVTASLDSVQLDSTAGYVTLFLGEPYQWSRLRTLPADAPLLEAIHFPSFKGNMDFATLGSWQKQILDYLEENGHPFGKVYLDSIEMSESGVDALLRIERGPL